MEPRREARSVPEPDSVSDLQKRFSEGYGKAPSRVELLVEREVFGINAGINSWTTVAQADALADALALRPGTSLLDIGAGTGWPSLYLAGETGCNVVLTDVPVGALHRAARRASKLRLAERCAFVQASGVRLPLKARTFDAIVHADVL